MGSRQRLHLHRKHSRQIPNNRGPVVPGVGGRIHLPAGLRYSKFEGGKYSRFVLTGSYSNLPQASGRVFEIVSEKKLKLRGDYCIEHYANDPKTTPEEQLVTEILIPTI